MKNLSLNKGRPSCLCIIIFAILVFQPIKASQLTLGGYSLQMQQKITGNVTDVTGPLPSVTVTIKGTTISTVTDEKGDFSIPASPTDILVFSFLGFASQEILVGNQTSLKIVMAEDSTQLQEVTINAGYYSVKEKERTGSIARITSKDIETQPVTNVLATMQGRMAGVQVIQDSGMPGGGFQIKIRGQNSLRADGNNPLYIIDGVPYSSEPIGYSQTSTALPSATSPLNSINPADIQSIEILKDADATAIYGSRGANGVVLITTKKGKAGKTTFSVSSSTGAAEVSNFVNLMKTPQYLAMRRQAFSNDGVTQYPATAYDINGTWNPNRYTDWQKELTGGTANTTNTQISLSGGSESTQYFISGTYYKESTVFPGDFGYQKGALHFNLNNVSDDKKFKVSMSGNYTAQDNDLPGTDLTRFSRSLAPNAPALYTENGDLNWEGSTFNNPLAELLSEFKATTNDLVLNGTIAYQLAKGLEAKVSMGLTDLKTKETKTLPSTMYDPAYGIGSTDSALMSNLTMRKSWIIEPQLNYTSDLWQGKLSALVGATAQQQKNNVLYQMGYGYSSNSLIYNLASANQVSVLGSNETVYKYQAFFGRLNYVWNNRYIINLTGRRDGSSRFGPGKQFANFGAIGAAWNFSNESFLNNSNGAFSFGKLRASYGITGNDQIGDYQFINTYESTGVTYNGIIGLTPTRLFNPDFGWEKNKKFELGLETGFLKDRIFFTVSWYKNRSSNQLVGIPLAGTTGFTTINSNLDATVQNTGVEFTLRTENIKNKNFVWTTNLNISCARNKLIEFPGLETSSYSNTYVIGQPITIAKLYQYNGIDPVSGIYKFEDVNGDGAITSDKDRQTVADLTPDFFGGLQNQFQYKNWALDFLFQFTRQQVYDYNAGVPAGQMYNQRNDADNAWTVSGDSAPYQVLTAGGNSAAVQAYYNYTSSDATIVDGSFIRLKNIALSYSLPSNIFKGLHCKFYVQGQNVLTFTPYKGADPEFKNSGFLPPLKMYTAGVQLSF